MHTIVSKLFQFYSLHGNDRINSNWIIMSSDNGTMQKALIKSTSGLATS